MKSIRTTCPYCGVGCGIKVSSEGAITGDADHPANFGKLCSKGAALGDTLGLEGRLLTPKIKGRRASWDEAIDLVADRFFNTIRDHGPDSVAFYVSGQLLNEDYYVANKLMKGFIGSANIDTNSRLCMASSVAGHKRAFGTDTVPGTYEDLELADLVVLVGSNLGWCHPVLFQRILAAKSARPQMKIINIDPRNTISGKAADLQLSVNPDGDSALFNGLLSEIVRRGAVDHEYVASHVSGFNTALAMANSSDEAESGLSAEELKSFYDLWIGSPKVVTIFSQGVNQSVGGSDKVNAIINCHLATGRIGRPGMGPFSITGQPNAMGGREVGGLANMLACHLDIDNPDHRNIVQNSWQSPTMCTKPGLKAVDMFRACATGQIKALWIISTNPAVSMPNADFVVNAIKNVDFTVVSEVMAKTDTSVLTDVQLPASAWGEKTGTVTNSERRISMQRAFLPAPGEARPDWQIICDVAKRMGWSTSFSYSGPADIFREHAELSGRAASQGRDFDISGLATISDKNYDNFLPVQWPVTDNQTTGQTAGGRFFANGKFYHPDTKARMIPVASIPAIKPTADIFHLNTGRIRDQWHTMTRSGKSPRLNQHSTEPFAQIHFEDALRIGLKKNELLEIEALQDDAAGHLIVRANITTDIPRGMIFVPMHWSSTNASAARVNTLFSDCCDPVSGQPALKAARVRAKPFMALWYGFAASVSSMRPNRPYSVVALTKTGWSCELAGLTPVADWEAEAREVLNLNTGDASILYDAAKGISRVAIYEGQKLIGLFFAAPKPLVIARTHVISHINTIVPALTALAGLPKNNQHNPGRIVCACSNVGMNTIQKAIHNGAANLATLGDCTNAGIICGSCRPELQELIDTTPLLTAAE